VLLLNECLLLLFYFVIDSVRKHLDTTSYDTYLLSNALIHTVKFPITDTTELQISDPFLCIISTSADSSYDKYTRSVASFVTVDICKSSIHNL
jgi:hypothetical protein